MTSKNPTSQTEADDGTLGAMAPALLRKLEDLVGLARMRPGKLHEYKAALQSADDLIAEGRGRQGGERVVDGQGARRAASADQPV